MKRAPLSATLCCAVLTTGLYTALVTSQNHAGGRELDALQRSCEELAAVRARLRVEVDAHVPGVLDPPQTRPWLLFGRIARAEREPVSAGRPRPPAR